MDPVFQSVLDMRELLSAFQIREELSNGHLEKELKLVLASALRRQNLNGWPKYISVSDKHFNSVPIDLFAFEILSKDSIARPAFWIELKSTFKQAGKLAAEQRAIRTLSQVRQYMDRLMQEQWKEAQRRTADHQAINTFRQSLLANPVYIVHFLNVTPAAKSCLPRLVLEKYPKRSPVDANEVCRAYDSSAEHIASLEQQITSVDREMQREISAKIMNMRDYIRANEDRLQEISQELAAYDLQVVQERLLAQERSYRVVATEMRKCCAESQVISYDGGTLDIVVAKYLP